MLRLVDRPGSSGARSVTVFWEAPGFARRSATQEVAIAIDDSLTELVRWYLEEYAEFPSDPAPALAVRAEGALADLGGRLFQAVFGTGGGAQIWGQVTAGGLDRVRVEVDADPADVPGLTLLNPDGGEATARIRLDGAGRSAAPSQGPPMPEPPDVGFFGRDETLLALDRAFDTSGVVLLHELAGAGKTTTVAEFARWYVSTGGLDHPQLGPGPVLWTSFEHHTPLDRVLDAVGAAFNDLLEANDIHWAAVTDPGKRRELALAVLAQVPVLWVWDNVEPVAGFPEGTPSTWTAEEQAELLAFLRDLKARTKAKVLLTSRRDEQRWLGLLPTRLRLPAMPIAERLLLANAIAANLGQTKPVNWLRLLRFTGGNPLTITVAVRQALREGATASPEALADFVGRITAGGSRLEDPEDAALGRSGSLAASLDYGFKTAFTEAEQAMLAVLHLFRNTVGAPALVFMGDPEAVGANAVPTLAGLTPDAAIALLDKAVDIGLLTSYGGGYYGIHPVLPGTSTQR